MQRSSCPVIERPLSMCSDPVRRSSKVLRAMSVGLFTTFLLLPASSPASGFGTLDGGG